MDGVELLDGVGVAGAVDQSLNVVNMSGSADLSADTSGSGCLPV